MPTSKSIDNFINSHPGKIEIETMAKLGIVSTILDAEEKSRLNMTARPLKLGHLGGSVDLDQLNYRSSTQLDTWFNHFFKLFNDSDVVTLRKRLTSINLIIFNYDRCVEHYLYLAIQTHFLISPDEAADIIREMHIFHPYGTVGHLPWMPKQGRSESVNFGEVINPDKLLTLSSNIKTFSEGATGGENDVEKIRNSIGTAKLIVFLGYGYLKINQTLLAPGATKPERLKILGTALGESDNNKYQIIQEMKISFRVEAHNENQILDNTATCAQFFDRYHRSISSHIT